MKYIINSKNIITHYHCMASPLEIYAVNLYYQIGMGQLNVEVDLKMADCYFEFCRLASANAPR